jgi:hypothetical protein
MPHRSVAKPISDQRFKPCWKNRPTLKLWREFARQAKKRLNVTVEQLLRSLEKALFSMEFRR